jgi:excinuclease ABC subunit A
VDEITGIPPAIAIEQKVNTRNPRSTVGTTTEIYDYLRLLYSRIGKTYSPVTGEEVRRHSAKDVLNYISSLEDGSPVYILVPLGLTEGGDTVERLLSVKEQGFSRLFLDGELL